ncbi:hypothetical protein Peur_025981 [Populus x canadensis]
MALELIGGSILSALVEVLVDRLASREVRDFFKSHELDDGLLEKLNETLNTVNGLLDDAEEKQITKRAVKNWLNDVKHAVYEAEDILEEIDYEYLRSKDINAPRPDSNWVRDRVPFLNPANRRTKEMGAELQKILEKLERLLKQKGDLRHIEGTGGWRPLSEKTTPLVNEPAVYGRDADKEAIMECLLTQHKTDGSNLVVVPIVGMGGIGKTTLAQLIYNDRRVDECFELKAWVWASQQFDVARIIKDIIKKINASTCPTKEPDESLMEAVKGKKLLLVLDDAWNIEYNEWDKLLLPLRYVEYGNFSMHDLISDLAEYVSGEFCFKLGINESGSGLEGEHSCSLPERTRYLSITSAAAYGGGLRIFRSIHGVQHWRTLFPLYILREVDNEALNDILPNLKRLRMLSLCHPKDISSPLLNSIGNLKHLHISSQLLNSIGNLKHLRHLDLSCTAIERLPESVCTLYYLRSLLLKECRHLMELPSNLSNLFDLQHLDIEGTNLKEMPPKMGKLTKLQILDSYIVGKDSGSSMKELGKLSHIRKKLSIRNLRDVANAQDALDANLKGKKKIEELGLRWDGSTDDTPHERDVLEKLEPSEDVKELAIIGYGGTTFPGWLGNSSFSNMATLLLYGCKNCILLPPLGQLPSLEELHIEGFDDVVAVSSEFYGSDPLIVKPFKSLKILTFAGMKKWHEWKTDVDGAFPHLEKLLIAGCPELANALPSHLPCLWSLYIQECPQLVVSIPEAPMLDVINVSEGDESRISGVSDLPCLHFRRDPQLKGMEQMSHLDPSSFTEIKIEECSSFKRCQLDLLPRVSTLTIEHCPNLESLCIGEGPLPALCHLRISHCPNLVSFPKGGLAASDLTRLVLEGCSYLKSLPENMHSLLPSLQNLQLISLPEVDSFPEGGLPSKLHTLCIEDCIKLKVCGLQALPSLSCFIFTGNDVESFDEETLPSTLTTLVINRLGNLKSLDYKGLHHLTSLQVLGIEGCHKLESISEQALPSSLENLDLRNLESLDYMGLHHLTSLQRLYIAGCPKLESISELALPSSLKYLYLRNLESLDYKGLHHLTSLYTLKIKSCPKVEFISEQVLPSSLEYQGLHHLTSLTNLSIKSYPKLESISERALPSSLEYLHLCKLESLDYIGLQHLTSLHKLKIGSCPKLESLQWLPSSLEFLQLWDQQDRDYKELRHLTSLRKMKIRRSLKLESFQEGTLPSSLEDLEIWDLEDLEYKGFRHLTSLRELHICSSPKLESVPGEKLPSSLVSLQISARVRAKRMAVPFPI